MIKPMSQDALTTHTGMAYDASRHSCYLWLAAPVEGHDKILIIRYLDEDVEGDSPELYAAWDEHWDDMYQEYLAELQSLEA